jgi:arylsulfatase A-like enzyme
MVGRSWKPLLSAPTDFSDWRHAFFYEYFYEHHYGSPTTLAVRTDTAKLITYPGHPEWNQLFDLKHDPLEMHNLYNDPSAKDLRARMEFEFDKQEKAVHFHTPANADQRDPNEVGHF